MSSPVQLSDLDLATVADDADLALIRKSDTTDYKILVSNLRSINIAGMPQLNSPMPTDLMIIARTGTNYKAYFGTAGFAPGPRMWFYQADAPNGIAPVFWKRMNADKGDTLLAVAGGSTYTSGGTQKGTWQQTDHTLTLAEIPAHNHRVRLGENNSETSGKIRFSRRAIDESFTSGTNPASNTYNAGGGGGHNHGDTWRPTANVGILCEKKL
jgi:hypothetical protein